MGGILARSHCDGLGAGVSSINTVAAEALTDPHLIPLHPELTGDPATLKWVVSRCPYHLGLAATHPSGPLSALINDAVLATTAGGPGWITTTVQDPSTWKDVAGQVRRAVRETVASVLASVELADAGSAATSSDVALGPGMADADLRVLAEQILEQHITPIAGAHGGRITVVSVGDGVVRVNLMGACHGCPAAVFTLQQRFQQLLQRCVPGVRVLEI